MSLRLLAISSLCALALVACGEGDATETTQSDAISTTTTELSGEPSTSVEPPPRAPDIDLNEFPEWFQVEDAAPASLVQVIGDELGADYIGSMAVQWPTGGLGCGSGGNELQVITPGHVIFFDSGDGLIRVHSSDSGLWKECDLGRPLDGTPVLTS
ncbi:MAG: hypothetical protein ACFCU2_00835 [Acidimicrobiia bacterium]